MSPAMQAWAPATADISLDITGTYNLPKETVMTAIVLYELIIAGMGNQNWPYILGGA
jgi:hypothetical protein